MKKMLSLLLILALLALTLSACGSESAASPPSGPAPEVIHPSPPEEGDEIQGLTPEVVPIFDPLDIAVGTLNGNTGVSVAWLMDQAEQGFTVDNYSFEIATAPDQIVSMLLSDQVQIAALPTNVAAMLYNRSEGAVQLAAIVAYGVLHVLENGGYIELVEDLLGRTIHTTGEGAGPEFILNHILTSHGLIPGEDVYIEFHANEALAAQMAAGQIDLSMMPEPMVTSVLAQNEDVRRALDITQEWDAVTDSPLVMSSVVVRRDFAEAHPEAVLRFLELLHMSIEETNANPQAAGELVAQFGIIPSARIAALAIPGCNLTFLAGAALEPAVIGYLQVLYSAYPASIGGAIPSENFYFIANHLFAR